MVWSNIKKHRNFFGYINFKLYMLCALFTSIMSMISNSTMVLMISVFTLNLFCKYEFVWLRYYLYSLFVSGIIFLFLKLIVSILSFAKDSQNILMQSSPVYIMFLLHTIKYRYRRHWISAGNILTYFCCRQFFLIIFTSMYFLIRLTICWI